MSISTLARTESELEFARTRLFLERMPQAAGDYQPHPKSMMLRQLASHLAEVPGFCLMTLTSSSVDLAALCERPFAGESREEILEHFDQLVGLVASALAGMSDQAFEQTWMLTSGNAILFSGNRYTAYRQMGVNHMIHHRAQLGTYLRSLNVALPACYGPSADEAA